MTAASPALDVPVTGKPADALPLLARRENHFNLIRLALAVLVILAHSPELIDGTRAREPLTRMIQLVDRNPSLETATEQFRRLSFGELAVNGFFLLSGFLIVQSWTRDPDLGRFLKKRVLRIYPAFIAASVISVFLVGWIGRTPGHYLDGFRLERFVRGLVFLNQPKAENVFAGTHHDVVNGALWTIQYEFRCYLLVAVLGLCGIFRNRIAWGIFAAGAVVAYGIIASVNWLTLHPVGGDTTSMVRFIAFFAMGGAFYLWRERVTYRAGWVIAAAVISVASLFNQAAPAVVLPTLGAYVFFGLAFAKADWLTRSPIGADISYGTYLYGWPTQKVLLWYWPGIGPWTLFVLASAVAMALGWLSWELIERPFLKLKPRGQGAKNPTGVGTSVPT